MPLSTLSWIWDGLRRPVRYDSVDGGSFRPKKK